MTPAKVDLPLDLFGFVVVMTPYEQLAASFAAAYVMLLATLRAGKLVRLLRCRSQEHCHRHEIVVLAAEPLSWVRVQGYSRLVPATCCTHAVALIRSMESSANIRFAQYLVF